MYSPKSLYRKLRKKVGPRRFQIYAVGPGKSGTNSLANLFQENYRSAHEAEAHSAIELLIRYWNGEASEQVIREYLIAKDARQHLEMDSAGYNAYFAPFLAELFPRAKFILSVRNCFSWANSAINQALNVPTPQQHWLDFRHVVFGEHSDRDFSADEAVLREHSLWPLESIFSVWAQTYSGALAAVPKDKLLIVEIRDIGKRLQDVADFAGISLDTLTASESRSYQAPRDFGLLTRIDRGFVNAKALQVCGPLMKELYPDSPCQLENFMQH